MSQPPPRAIRRRRLVAATIVVVPALVGAAAALLVYAWTPGRLLYVQGPLWLVLLLTGLVVSAAAVVPMAVSWQVARARGNGTAEMAQVAAADHRRFLLRLDHELKNPLTAMQAALANLAAAGPGKAGQAETSAAVASVSVQTRRLADLVGDLRKLAELETRPIEQAPVDLAELLAEVCELTDLTGRFLSLTLPHAPWPLAKVPGDRDLLFLALFNLLGNAVKFTLPGDRIELRARDEGDQQVVVEVADTGVGIPPDEVGQVWEELARGRAARGTPGMGLGLALVRAVVVRHGGAVSVRSREGHGTVVTLRLPAIGMVGSRGHPG